MFHDDAPLAASDIEDGSYFRKARLWYSDIYHFPIAERSFYIIIILMAVVNSIFAVQAFNGVFPLVVKVPFLTYSEDAWVDQPVAKKIALSPTEDKNLAVMRFMLETYVTNRESYDLEHYELRYRNIASQSTRGVFDKYKDSMDASNLYSPYRIYTNRFKRTISITAMDFQYVGNDEHAGKDENIGKDAQAQIEFYASIVNLFDGREVKHSKFRVDINYHYDKFEINQNEIDQRLNSWMARFFLRLTGDSIKVSGDERKVVPMKFVVSGYNVRELLE